MPVISCLKFWLLSCFDPENGMPSTTCQMLEYKGLVQIDKGLGSPAVLLKQTGRQY